MLVSVNGESRDVATGTTVAALLASLDLDPSTLVVQRNEDIIELAQHADTVLAENDQIELVRFVGGG
jgi:thiamine biosynthesis protein ThiS